MNKPTIPLSIVILTKNEERFIRRCLDSVQWADEIVVLDSGSTDQTREIATSMGAKVYEQEWLGYSKQRNKAISLATNDWVFPLDCDELITSELANSIRKILSNDVDPYDGFSVNRRGDFHGILLPNSSSPKRKLNFIRLFNRCYSKYDPTTKVHEEVQISGRATLLQGDLIHWRAYTMDEYISSINRYATLEAEALSEKGHTAPGWKIFLMPILRFLWCYILHRGFLLGRRGLVHAMLKASSEYVRYAKLWEMQNIEHSFDPPPTIYQLSESSQIVMEVEA